jgi:serine phosphatase RsbU (regulator of sigma subunit)
MDYYKELIIEQDLFAKISEQKEEIERQQRELQDSLRYAGSIQSALLPDEKFIRKLFPESFIFFQPRDIVSGDFYWIYKKRNVAVLVAADCTGHGVPGAFMSILGISFLNEIISNGIPKANIIMNKLRENIMKTLHQSGDVSKHKDGIDLALVIIDFEKKELQFSGAFNPMYLIRNGNLIEFRGDKMPIGIAPTVEKSFTNKRLKIREGDILYIFSDGYADQFGGAKEKKFRYGPFKDLLLKIHRHPMDKQKHLLEHKFLVWKGGLEQVDDILIIGLKILA